jgi:RNA polymerase sigma-70 factor (ECF subfamily)
MILNEESRLVGAALGALPEAQRESLRLAYFECLTHVEIAARTGLPLGTVKSNIRQGLMKLRGALAPGMSVRGK